jgi:hypothetical protein
MKLLAALAAVALTAGPAIASPTFPTEAERAQQIEWSRVLRLQGLKEKADKVCRVTVDIRLFNPYGGTWASKGDYIAAAAASGEHESIPTRPWVTDDYAHLVKDCPLGRMAQYAGNSAEANRAFVSSYLPSAPIAGGPVYVRSHQRCNTSKCWNVRAYTRSR